MDRPKISIIAASVVGTCIAIAVTVAIACTIDCIIGIEGIPIAIGAIGIGHIGCSPFVSMGIVAARRHYRHSFALQQALQEQLHLGLCKEEA